MRILFVVSGNNPVFDIAPFIKIQGDSLIRKGIHVCYFRIKEKGLQGYFKSISKLSAYIRKHPIDIIHSHYVLSAFVSLIASPFSVHVVSLMGTDIIGNINNKGKIKWSSYYLRILSYIIQIFAKHIIVKSDNLYQHIWYKKKTSIIPNGIDLDLFKYNPNVDQLINISSRNNTKKILFLGNTKVPNKNYLTLTHAIKNLENEYDIDIITPYPITHHETVKYFSASDIFVMCSFSEGSPNVVKEAMAIGIPIVATRVGDVVWLLSNVKGAYLCDPNQESIANALYQAIEYSERKERSSGRNKLIELKLDINSIAERIINIYNTAM